MITMKKTITLKYANALATGSFEFSGEFEDVSTAVNALVKTFETEFNPANLDFQTVLVDGVDLGIDGLTQAEVALQKFYN